MIIGMIIHSGTTFAASWSIGAFQTGNEVKNVAEMRDRLRILGALLVAPLVGFGSEQASAGVVTKKKTTKKKAKKKTTKKKAKKKTTKKKAKKISEPGTAALIGAGLVAVGAAHKLGRRKKKNP
jgi:preprotein translocase subunit SecF